MKFEDALKGLEWLIKTPFWIYMAATVAFGVFLFNWPVFVSWGLEPDFKFLGLPVAFWAIASAALTVVSLLSRLNHLVEPKKLLSNCKWCRRISELGSGPKAILTVLDEDGRSYFNYPPRDSDLRVLRDKGFIQVDLTAPDGSCWGQYRISIQYGEFINANQELLRKLLGHEDEFVSVVRQRIYEASQARGDIL